MDTILLQEIRDLIEKLPVDNTLIKEILTKINELAATIEDFPQVVNDVASITYDVSSMSYDTNLANEKLIKYARCVEKSRNM